MSLTSKVRCIHLSYCNQTCVHSNSATLYNVDQTLVNSLHGLLNCEMGGLDRHVIKQSIAHVSIVYTYFVIHWCM